MTYKRYMVFAGLAYDSLGGWGDYKESYEVEESAKQKAEELVQGRGTNHWSHVVDIETRKKVAEFYQRWETTPWTKFVVGDSHGRYSKSLQSFISIAKDGCISFSTQCCINFNLYAFPYCVMYYDTDRNRLGFEGVDDKKVVGKRKLYRRARGRKKYSGLQLSGSALLKYRNAIPTTITRYEPIKEDGLLVISLDKPIMKKEIQINEMSEM